MKKMHTKNLLMIFVRNPVLGRCKTRLAATIGDEPALAIYEFLLAHTAAITAEVPFDKTVYYSEEIIPEDSFVADLFKKAVQKGEDLGVRMENAFKQSFDLGYEKVIIIGSDLYDLKPEDIALAFEMLDNSDYVIGPSEDGGYYLLGMRKLKKELFRGKPWGTAAVLEMTFSDLSKERIALLPAKNDIDVYDDIKDEEAFAPFLIDLST